MNKKYVLTTEVNERGLHRIVALRDIPRHNVKKGDLGGFVESEKNLSQEGDAWVGGNAQVFGDAKVYDNAFVYGNAQVFGGVKIGYAPTLVHGNAKVFGNASVGGEYVSVYGNAKVFGNASVSGSASIFGDSCVFGNARVFDMTHVCGDAIVYGNACVCGCAKVEGDAEVCGDAFICADEVYKNVKICEYPFVKNTSTENKISNSNVNKTILCPCPRPCCCPKSNVESTINEGEKHSRFGKFILNFLSMNSEDRKKLNEVLKNLSGEE